MKYTRLRITQPSTHSTEIKENSQEGILSQAEERVWLKQDSGLQMIQMSLRITSLEMQWLLYSLNMLLITFWPKFQLHLFFTPPPEPSWQKWTHFPLKSDKEYTTTVSSPAMGKISLLTKLTGLEITGFMMMPICPPLFPYLTSNSFIKMIQFTKILAHFCYLSKISIFIKWARFLVLAARTQVLSIYGPWLWWLRF